GLDHFDAKHESPYGEIVSAWKKAGEEVEYKVQIPANSTATLILSASGVKENRKDLSENETIVVVQKDDKQIKLQLVSGTYLFEIKQ
ncbi:alpha-L-rhamnosidase C-terminal domain-containing protein, partial [Mariniphaga sediminis]|uniref:alpha-L-rhamnosidase C-terminal domain-containing protein n=1 Tax=Mariniphaga sediminis TaxID=1628158 RepID=UPI003564E6E4